MQGLLIYYYLIKQLYNFLLKKLLYLIFKFVSNRDNTSFYIISRSFPC